MMEYNLTDSHSMMQLHSNAMKPSFTQSFRILFYGISPKETFFKDVSLVPDYTAAAVTSFFTLIGLELVIACWKGHRTLRINDSLTSIHAGVCSRLIRLLTEKSFEMAIYFYVYDNWRIANLPWDSSLTWFVSFIGMDFAYYWFHRAAHEINLFWMSHQTHHSSEDYNLTTALRQSSLQGFISAFFYAPCGLIIPPSVHLVHLQVNILFQFWIHTELIDSLGPLEYILNTPSHHRVHHGRNPYCIDKNYAGALIIWDRMFGTFAAERKSEKIAYGLVSPLNSFDPTYVQLGYVQYILRRIWKTDGLWNKACVLIKGPGWSPGKPRLGKFEDLPEIENPILRYDVETPMWVSAYAVVHSLTLLPLYDQLMLLRYQIAGHFILFDVIFLLAGLTCLGYLFDKKPYAYTIECVRCSLFIAFLQINKTSISQYHELPVVAINGMEVVYLLSVAFWLVRLAINKPKKKIA